jgi:hypothetical protein
MTKSSNHTLSLHRLIPNSPWLYSVVFSFSWILAMYYSMLQIDSRYKASGRIHGKHESRVNKKKVFIGSLPSTGHGADNIGNTTALLLTACLFERVYLATGFPGSTV